MPESRKIEDSSVFACPHCTERYWVSYTRTPVRDSGTAYCQTCRKRMSEWNSTAQPSYTIIAPRGP